MKECPSLAQLSGPAPLPVAVAAHVDGCRRCAALRRAFEARLDSGGELSAAPMIAVEWPNGGYAEFDAAPRPGAVHSVWGPESGELMAAVVMDVDEHEALIVPVSAEPQMAGDADVLIGADILAYGAMFELWNHIYVLTEQVAEQVAVLPADLMDRVDAALDNVLNSEPVPPGLPQGPALIGENDPRHLFRDREAARARMFVEPWRLLNAGETLGAVMGASRTELELSVNDLGSKVDLAADVLVRLEADDQDLHAEVAVSDMARLVIQLKFQPSQRLSDLVQTAVFENDRRPEVGTEPVLARRRTGVRSAARPPSEEVRREHARQYAERLLNKLQELR